MPVSGTAEGAMKRACEEGRGELDFSPLATSPHISPTSPLHLPYISLYLPIGGPRRARLLGRLRVAEEAQALAPRVASNARVERGKIWSIPYTRVSLMHLQDGRGRGPATDHTPHRETDHAYTRNPGLPVAALFVVALGL